MNRNILFKNIVAKKTYLEQRINTDADLYLISNSRKDRDRVIKGKGKLDAYKEILDIISKL